MITKYNTYNLIQEKSILSFLKVNKNLIRDLYKDLPLKDNFYWSPCYYDDTFDSIKRALYYLVENSALLIKFEYNTELFIFRELNLSKDNYYSNRYKQPDTYIAYDNYNYGPLKYYYEDLVQELEKIFDRRELKEIFIFSDIFRENKKESSNLYYEDMLKLFDEKYRIFLIKLYNGYKKVFRDLYDNNKDNKKYTDELLKDIGIASSVVLFLKNNSLDLERRAYNDIIAKYAKDGNISIKSDDSELINKILRDMLVRYHRMSCSRINFFKYHKWSRELQKNPTYYKTIKNSINNPEFIKEWEFLENATNFDLF